MGYDFTYGICDAPSSLLHSFAKMYKVPQNSVTGDCYGLNHLSFFDSIKLDGKEILPELLKDERLYTDTDMRFFKKDLVEHMGCILNEYLYYFYYREEAVQHILDAVYRMAARKQKANLERPEGEKYAELQRVRLGSRLLAYLPMRINDGLVDVLREFKEKASAIGVKQFIIQTHFQTPLEVTPEAKEAIRKILSAGWIITNQLVYTVAASRRGHTTRLRQVLNSLGVVCYYTFSVKGFNENYAVFAPNSRSMQEQQEEKIYGRMTPEQAEELYKILETKVGTEEEPKEDVAKQLRRFMRKHHLPFLATDRSVLNLPAIGKSMTFQLVGLTEEGKRILRFEHDGTRHHSPIIDQMGQIYIVENKSLAAYLRQLAKMGEDPEDYASIWNYTKGETEPRFSLYEYPDFPFRTTDKMSNLSIKN